MRTLSTRWKGWGLKWKRSLEFRKTPSCPLWSNLSECRLTKKMKRFESSRKRELQENPLKRKSKEMSDVSEPSMISNFANKWILNVALLSILMQVLLNHFKSNRAFSFIHKANHQDRSKNSTNQRLRAHSLKKMMRFLGILKKARRNARKSVQMCLTWTLPSSSPEICEMRWKRIKSKDLKRSTYLILMALSWRFNYLRICKDLMTTHGLKAT